MRPQFLNLATSSFSLWLENFVLSRGGGFTTGVSSLFYPVGSVHSGLYCYASPYQPQVVDSSIATPTTGIYVNGSFLQRNQTPFVDFNYKRNQAFFTSPVSNVSGYFTLNEINILPLNISEDQLLFETKFSQRSKTSQSLSGLKSNTYTYPSIYIKGFSNRNEPYAFGGEDLSKVTIGLFLIMESVYQVDALKSILADAKQELVPLFTEDKFPFNIYGGLKETGSNFNYSTLKTAYLQAGSGLYIEDATISSFKREYNVDSNNLNPGVFWAVADIILSKSRYPRQNTQI